jgi:hypothetical protein
MCYTKKKTRIQTDYKRISQTASQNLTKLFQMFEDMRTFKYMKITPGSVICKIT